MPKTCQMLKQPSLEAGFLLHLLNTPANCRYLETLTACYEAAPPVDRECYRIGTDGQATHGK